MRSYIKDQQLFLTATKTQPYPPHPKTIDSEKQLKDEITKSIILATGYELGSESFDEKPKNSLFKKSESLFKLRESRSQQDLNYNYNESQNDEIKQHKVKQEELLKHKYRNLRIKLTVTATKYFYKNYPVKPGFNFFDSLIKAPRVHINTLRQNIPESLYYTDKLYYLHTLPNGNVECTTEIFGYKFMQEVESHRKPAEGGSIIDTVAAVMRGKSDEEQDMQKIALDWNQFKVKMIGNETIPMTLLQRYIKSPGGRPAITRLYYFANVKSNRANYAYSVKRLNSEGNIQKCVVEMAKPETLEVFKMAGSSLKPFEAEAEKIVEFLNKGYNIRIQEIIFDYLRDQNGLI